MARVTCRGETMSEGKPDKQKGFEPSTVENLSGMVQYQKGSIVSRVIAKKPSGNVTMFAFDKGEGLSEHTSPFDALAQIVDGEAEIIVAGVRHQLGAGDLILLPANVPHALEATRRFKMLLTMLRS